MARGRHPKKEIEAAVSQLENLGWRIELSKHGHVWGRAFCPMADREGCKISIYSTPRNAENHARNISRFASKCNHGDNDEL